jgi:hypothetical protein
MFVILRLTAPVNGFVLKLLSLILVGSAPFRSAASRRAKSDPSSAEPLALSRVMSMKPLGASDVFVAGSSSSAMLKTARLPRAVLAGPTSLITATSSSSGKTLVQQV